MVFKEVLRIMSELVFVFEATRVNTELLLLNEGATPFTKRVD
jgi:hypothetical protein